MAYNLEFATNDTAAYSIVAVAGLVESADQTGRFVMVHNSRGWDIPGGRLEAGETPEQAFNRELMEESGHQAVAPLGTLALLEITGSSGLAVAIYHTTGKHVGQHTATEEISEWKLGTAEELVADYFGDKNKMQTLITMAAKDTVQ